MEILNCSIDSSLIELPDHLIVQIFEVDEGDDWGDTAVGGDSIIIGKDDIEGDYSIEDIAAHPELFSVEGNTETGCWIERKAEQSAD